MTLIEANEKLDQGLNVRLPEWRGYWFQTKERKVKALTKDGDIKDAWALAYMDRLDWEIAEGLDFGWAICALKSGKLVSRKGWNGSGLFVFMQVPTVIGIDIVPKMQSLPQAAKDEFALRGICISYSNQLALVKPDNSINGWAPSSADSLAEDWQLFESN